MLIPDFQGNWDALATVMAAGPDILNHNVETVPRLYARVRPKADLHAVARAAAARQSALAAHADQVRADGSGSAKRATSCSRVFADLRANDVDVLTVGQYLRPTLRHLPVERHVTPDEFERLQDASREAWVFGTSRAARWCGRATTHTPSYNSREPLLRGY